ncbi:PleD family two-component system response regulator [Parvularcula marina]|uniref:diguanylate cyclase n=1 Tax=Parvularcula marina TaxID=2292771 RepID=A0A371RJU8_9PROT|nr:PleD family two-component system response regulator [Parvularcula marina]RFB05720.1 PleD family two-component system response regulator [Parvularcula marina]
MTARVLVVDDLIPNVRLLEAKLRAEYFEVLTALSGQEGIDIALENSPDIILLDVMMPGLDGFETCERLKADPRTCHIPVVMVTALDQQADRIAGLKAGADDFLTKPVQDLALFARVRSLTRLKQMTDELRHRHAKGAELGAIMPPDLDNQAYRTSEILVISEDLIIDGLSDDVDGLPEGVTFNFENDPRKAIEHIRSSAPDMLIVDLGLKEYDPLRLCSAIRSFEESRLTPLLALAHESEMRKLVRALDIGVNDYLMRPIDSQEMVARVRTQLRRQWYVEDLRQSVQQSLELAVTDALTGLYNRRYLGSQLPRQFGLSKERNLPFSLIILDVDHFKVVNDTHGHDVGDEVLVEISDRLKRCVRGMDIACRYGGEEFVCVLPETDQEGARVIAERVREDIANRPMSLSSGQELDVTVSIGLATHEPQDAEDTPPRLLKRADEALYAAKTGGRNRVVPQTELAA